MRIFLIILFFFTITPVSAWTNATNYLVKQQIKSACNGAGKISPSAVIERDLTGDGKRDLVISHDGISCRSGGRSLFCGIRACSVYIYVRQGSLLKLRKEILSIGASVGKGAIPSIKLMSHNFQETSLRWTGRGFK